jgi:hypothetical protein
VALGAALFAGHSAASGGGVTLPALLAARLGLGHGHDPVAALMLEIEELYPMSPLRLLFDPRELVVLGAWLVVAPFAVWRLGRVADRAPGPAPMLLAFVAGSLVALTLLFARTSALLAPIACVVLGGVIARSLPTHPAPRTRGAVKPAAPPWLAWAALWAALASGAVTAVAGVVHAMGAWSHLGGDETRALRFVAERTPPNAIVATLWDVGYDLQARGRRASLVDGLIEDDENRRRIVALDQALMERRAEPLARLCDRYRVGWLLVPDATSLQSVAAVASDPVAGKIVRGEPLIEGVDTDRVLYHLMMGDAPTAGFRRAFVSGAWSVYEREAAPRD